MERARRSGSEIRKRSHLQTVRFTAEEHAELVRRADAAGISPASYLRLQSLDVPPPRGGRAPRYDQAALAQLLAHVGKLGSNMNQIARAMNRGRDMPDGDIAGPFSAVQDMRAALIKALGRKP